MELKSYVCAAVLTAGLGMQAMADNPISTYHYLADPSAAADDSTFYILTDVDDYNNQTNWSYDIIGLYAFSSNDMKNWTDHGMIFKSNREFGNYPNNTWASGIAVHNGRIFIVYPDGASGVGMITAPSIDGPYTDPIMETHGKNRIAGAGSFLGDCDGIAHCFDPGILFDDDGTGYVIFGGGESGQRPFGNNFDIIKFSENNGKVTLDRNSLTRVQLPNSFEAPYLHKKGSTYYLSFNNRSQVIDYGMSNNIMGPYNYVGSVIPGIGSVPDAHGEGGNNHQGFAEFQGKWYAVYHDRRLVTSDNHPAATTRNGTRSENPNYENHRSVSIDELTWNGDKMNTLKFTREGPAQIRNFDPYKTYKATTSSKQMNIRSRTDWTKGEPVKHVLLPLTSRSESWIRVSGVDFGKGAENLRIKAANVGDGNKVEIHTGSATGPLAGSCEIAKTSNNMTFTDNDCAMTGLTGVVDQLFFVFKGSKDSTMGLLEWEFQGTKREPEPQTTFGNDGKAWTVPGKIEAENFDEPGYGAGNDSYADNDASNHSCTDEGKEAECTDYREGTGVDIYKKADGKMVVGYINAGEWLEYTINVKEDGDYTLFAAVASEGGSTFNFELDGKELTGDMEVPAGGNGFDDFSSVKANVALTAGTHILRFNAVADWFDFDYVSFVKGKDAVESNINVTESDSGTTFIGEKIALQRSMDSFKVFDISGKNVGFVKLNGMSIEQALIASGYKKGVYVLRGMQNGKKFMVAVR
ncbi:MAG: carbohydrate-binding protein [Fibrobacter sp.]|nr:carbohydrate-binding protein [Fibrobacter sp.]